MARQPIVTRDDQGASIAVVGDVYRFLALGQDTAGRYAMFEALVPPGGGPPPHVHSREEESFFVLEGEVVITVDGQRIVAPEGTFANLPVGSLHFFKNKTDRPARLLISVAPAGLEAMFLEVGQAVNSDGTAPPPTPDAIAKLVAAAPRYGIELQLPPG